MEVKEIKKKLKKSLDKQRYQHTLGVMYTAGCLAMANGYSIEKAMLAGLLHDCAKCLSTEKKIGLCVKKNIDITQGYNIELYGEQFIRVMKQINIYLWCNKAQIPEYFDFYVKKHNKAILSH